MKRNPQIIILFILTFLYFEFSNAIPAVSKGFSQTETSTPTFSPPTSIKVIVYRLNQDLTCPTVHTQCFHGDSTFGCVHDPYGNKEFPYSTQPITASINNDYLLNVVPQEEDGRYTDLCVV